LLLYALAGFAASFVDGALGMGFGPTSSSILLASGLLPVAVSASVNIAKVVTGVASGLSHWRFHNLDRVLVLKLAIPGCIGAILGVTVLSSVSGPTIRPYLAMLLSLVGLRILVRFAQPLPARQKDLADDARPGKFVLQYDQRGVKTFAFIGGITNGLIGAWGPVVTPYLLHRGVRPRFAIGCVNTAEIAVAGTSVLSLASSVGSAGLETGLVVALLLGGVVAAPVAAWSIRRIPPRPIGVAVATLLLLTNARDLLLWTRLTGTGAAAIAYVTILALGIFALFIYPRISGSSARA
jgi:uncharacterized protein